MNQTKLPADPSSMTLGVIALVLILMSCCCYGIISPISITLSIIGLVGANRSLREYKNNAENYYPHSRQNVYNSKIVNLIALVLSIIIFAILTISGGSLLLYNLLELDEKIDINNSDREYYYDNEEDDYYYDNEDQYDE